MNRGILVALILALVGPPMTARSDNARATSDALERLSPGSFTRDAAAHLLRRAGFGGSPGEIDTLHALGLDGAVRHLVEYDRLDADRAAFEPTLKERPSYRTMRLMEKEERQKKAQELRRIDRRQFGRLRSWWLERMVSTKRPLEEKMALLWHGHFTSSYRDVRNSYHMYMQNELFREHATGNFGKLVHAVARDPAMLAYLNNRSNRKQNPNENFARELMELFTLGLGNYTEKDIRESARAFTGWTFAGNRFVFRKNWHDRSEKTFLGKTGNFDGDDIIDIILEQNATAGFIASKIFRYFAHDNPSPEIVASLAETFRSSGYELKPLLNKIFLSKEFYSSRSVGTRIKSPVLLVASVIKAAEVEPKLAPLFANISTVQLGQSLFDPPNVKGWPGGRDWITTSLLLQRYNLASSLLGEPGQMRKLTFRVRKMAKRYRDAEGGDQMMGPEEREKERQRFDVAEVVTFDVMDALEGLESPDKIVDSLCDRFLAVKPSTAFRTQLVEFLGSGPINRNRLHRLVQLIVSSPEFQLS